MNHCVLLVTKYIRIGTSNKRIISAYESTFMIQYYNHDFIIIIYRCYEITLRAGASTHHAQSKSLFSDNVYTCRYNIHLETIEDIT